MNAIFFHDFACQRGPTTTILTYALTYLPSLITIHRRFYKGKQPWPLPLITKCETIPDENDQFRLFTPHSGLLVSKSTLPRLLVEVGSESKKNWPEDLVRMVLTGATIVRFANGSLDRFMATEPENFVLCAILGQWSSRYSLYQELNNREVCRTSYITKLAG